MDNNVYIHWANHGMCTFNDYAVEGMDSMASINKCVHSMV